MPQLEAFDVENSLISFEMKEHLLIVWTLIANKNAPLRFQANQRSPTNKHGVREIHWYNEGVQGDFNPFVRTFQNDRHHDTSQRARTLGIHDVNSLAGIRFI